jgi:multiple sugar transport system permease protein/raffinose/stachyose/melibiose transport system permease protein
MLSTANGASGRRLTDSVHSNATLARSSRADRMSYALLSAPALVVYAVVIIIPIVYSLALSFTDWGGSGMPHFIGFANYISMFRDPIFWHSLRDNGLVIAISLIGQIPLGFFLAYILYRQLIFGRAFFEAIIFFPSLLSPVAVALLFGVVFAPSGLIAQVIGMILHSNLFELDSFNSESTAIIPYLIVILWMYTGLYMIIFLASLQKTNGEMLEAAVLDGANEWDLLHRVVLPGQIPVFMTSAIYAIAGSLKSFEVLWIMTNGGPSYYSNVLGLYMIQNTFTYYKYGFGSAIAVVLILLSTGLILLLARGTQYLSARFE